MIIPTSQLHIYYIAIDSYVHEEFIFAKTFCYYSEYGIIIEL